MRNFLSVPANDPTLFLKVFLKATALVATVFGLCAYGMFLGLIAKSGPWMVDVYVIIHGLLAVAGTIFTILAIAHGLRDPEPNRSVVVPDLAVEVLPLACC